MDEQTSLYDCFYDSTFHETRKDDFLKNFAQKKNDRERMAAVLALNSTKNLIVSDSFEGKSSIKSDRLLENGIASEAASDHFTAAILTAPHSSTAEASGYVARAGAFLSEGDPLSTIVDAERALELENLLEPEEVFQTVEALASALCITEQWDRAESVLKEGLQKLRSTSLDNSSKAAVVGKFVPLMRKARKMTEELILLKADPTKHAARNIHPTPELPTVSYGRNPALPAASAVVKFECSTEKGRHLVAMKDLKPGDIVIVEEPFAWSTQNVAALKTHCLHCLRRTRAPISCKNCSMVCYCGPSCRDQSWKNYHQFECSILGHLYNSNELSVMALLAYRTVISGGLEALSIPQKLPGAPSSATPFRSLDYGSVYWQESHSLDRTTDDLLKRTLTCAFLLRCLQKTGFLEKPMDTETPSEEEILLGSALLRHLQSCSCNAYEITETLIGGGKGVRHAEPLELGGAVYPTVSLLNHSCNGNLARHSINGKFCVVRASKNIRSGEELLDNYGVHFVNTPLAERQVALQRQYFFQCRCIACTEEWVTFDKLLATRYKCASCGALLGTSLTQTKACSQCNKGDLMKIRKRLPHLNTKYTTALQSLLEGCVADALKELIIYYEEIEKYVVEPCKELIKCQQAMNQCWSLLGNKDDEL